MLHFTRSMYQPTLYIYTPIAKIFSWLHWLSTSSVLLALNRTKSGKLDSTLYVLKEAQLIWCRCKSREMPLDKTNLYSISIHSPTFLWETKSDTQSHYHHVICLEHKHKLLLLLTYFTARLKSDKWRNTKNVFLSFQWIRFQVHSFITN